MTDGDSFILSLSKSNSVRSLPGLLSAVAKRPSADLGCSGSKGRPVG